MVTNKLVYRQSCGCSIFYSKKTIKAVFRIEISFVCKFDLDWFEFFVEKELVSKVVLKGGDQLLVWDVVGSETFSVSCFA